MVLFNSNAMMNFRVWPRFKVLQLIGTDDYRPNERLVFWYCQKAYRKKKHMALTVQYLATLPGCLPQWLCAQSLASSPYGHLFLWHQSPCEAPPKEPVCRRCSRRSWPHCLKYSALLFHFLARCTPSLPVTMTMGLSIVVLPWQHGDNVVLVLRRKTTKFTEP